MIFKKNFIIILHNGNKCSIIKYQQKRRIKMAKSSSRDYFGLGRVISIILAIIPFTAWILGVVTRFKEGKILAGVIRIFGGWLIWVLDLICMIFKGKILRLLNI